jgi:hypothetical protein
MATTIVTALVGKEILSQSVHNSTLGIFNGLNSMISDVDIKKIIKNLDIETKLNIINSFIKSMKDINLSEHIIISINSINEIIKEIETEINDINKEIIEHKSKWFYYLRKTNNLENINKLKTSVKILDYRFDILMKLL